METSDIIEIGLTIIIIGFSAGLVIYQLRKSRNLETIKYLSTIRKEIWELMDYKDVITFKNEEEAKENEKVRVVSQKLEYMAAAINNGDLSVNLIKIFCGRWFQGAVRILGIVENKKEKYEEEKYQEIKKLYEKLDELYNK